MRYHNLLINTFLNLEKISVISIQKKCISVTGKFPDKRWKIIQVNGQKRKAKFLTKLRSVYSNREKQSSRE